MKITTFFAIVLIIMLNAVSTSLAGTITRSTTVPPCPGATVEYLHDSGQDGTCREISWLVRYYPAAGGYVDVSPANIVHVTKNKHGQTIRLRVTWPAAVAGLRASVGVSASGCCLLQNVVTGCPDDPRPASADITENFFNPAITGMNGGQIYNCNISGTATFSVPNPVRGVTYTWSSSGNIGFTAVPTSGQGTSTATFSYSTFPSGTDRGSITVIATPPCSGYATQTFTKTVYRQPPPSNITGSSCIPNGGSRQFYGPEGTNYQWSTVPAGQFAFSGGTTYRNATVYALSSSSSGAVFLTYNRPCDNQVTTVSTGIYASQSCPSSFASEAPREDSLVSVYPNPASDQFTVEYKGSKKQYQLKLYNAYDGQVKESLAAGSLQTIKVSDLPEGLYYLHVLTDKGIITRKRIVIKK